MQQLFCVLFHFPSIGWSEYTSTIIILIIGINVCLRLCFNEGRRKDLYKGWFSSAKPFWFVNGLFSFQGSREGLLMTCLSFREGLKIH